LSFIIPNGLLRTTTYDTARKFILERTTIERIVDLKDGVFEGVTASTIILNLINNTDKRDTLIIDSNCKIDGFINEAKTTTTLQSNFLLNVSHTFSLYINPLEQRFFSKLSNANFFLKDIIIDIIEGIVAHKEFISGSVITSEYKPMLEGKDIKKYQTNFGGNYVLFDRKKIHRARPDYLWEAKKKIVIQRISGGKSPLVSTIDIEKYLAFASTNLLLIKESSLSLYPYELICALINSKLWNLSEELDAYDRISEEIPLIFNEIPDRVDIESYENKHREPVVIDIYAIDFFDIGCCCLCYCYCCFCTLCRH
jgi:type I restriction-modification system DNA methylase subunit